MGFVRGALKDADVILYVTDTVEKGDEASQEIVEKIKLSTIPTIVVINKIDLSNQARLEALVEEWQARLPQAKVVPVSALEGFNVGGVFDTIMTLLPEGAPTYDQNILLDKGAEKIGKKVGEEATEAVIAAIKGDADGLAGEAADLLYHLTVLLYQQGVSLRDVWEVLKKRHT